MSARPNFAIPESRFGMTMMRHNVAALPHDAPERDLLLAANEFNRIRYQELTVRQRLFVDAYLASGLDTTAAAIEAGYPSDEAERVGRSLIKKKPILKAVEAALAYHHEKSQLRLEPIISELRNIAHANIGKAWSKDSNGDLVQDLPDMDDPFWLTVSEITVDTYKEGRGEAAREVKRVKIKQYDKLAAIEKLLKIMNVTGIVAPQPVQQTTTVNGDVITTTNNIEQINLIAVPSGSFLPPPEKPENVLNYSPVIDMVKEGPLPQEVGVETFREEKKADPAILALIAPTKETSVPHLRIVQNDPA